MKTITKYQAYNGTEFTDEVACALYEAQCAKADAVISQLPPKPKLPSCGFENGDGYWQHDPETFRKVRVQLLKLAVEEAPTLHQLEQMQSDENIHPSWGSRFISECCNKQLSDAWYRIACTDAQFREWGQPYYRDHPEDAKQVCLNGTAAAAI